MPRSSAYEEYLVQVMSNENYTLLEALRFDFELTGVDVTCVVDICDYLEEKLIDLNKVQYYMGVYTGQNPDIELKGL